MRIGGLEKCSLVDFPGTVCATVFTQGCNFRCPYCHNPQLVYPDRYGALLAEEGVFSFLRSRTGLLEGVTVSGGEPCLQPDLPDFIRRVRSLGFKVKLDTNGSRPGMLERLLREDLLDYIAMDIKAPFYRYADLAGVPVETEDIRISIGLIGASEVPALFRTTMDRSQLDDTGMESIIRGLPSGTRYLQQECRSLTPGVT